MNQSEAKQHWAMLGTEGKAPTDLAHASRVLPIYSVGIQDWVDLLASRYLCGLCRERAHFKLVLAPYGGGKTHFLVTLGIRAREQENFAVANVPCGEGVSLDNPLDVYKELVKHLQLPGQDGAGLRLFLDAAISAKRAEIRKRGAPDVDAAFRLWLSEVRRRDYPANAFGRVLAAALQATDEGDESSVGNAALYWLQGDIDVLGRSEMQELYLARVPAKDRNKFGRDLLFSLVKVLPLAGVHGLVLLMDEVETLFQMRKGAAARRMLGAMRVILDAPTGVPSGVPLFGVFSATPDVLENFRKYPALEQRLAVQGASFDEGNEYAFQIPLDKAQIQLASIGEKLLEVGEIALGEPLKPFPFDRQLQQRNARRLEKIASERSLDVDARRLFVKTWVNLLNLQSTEGEREFDDDELMSRYSGTFDSVDEKEEFEP